MRIFCTINLIIAFVATAIWLNGCKKSNESSTAAISFKVPPGFPAPQYSFDQNPLTEQGFELGRKLFYDGKLSKDGNFPCASCHQPFAAFANFDHDLSHGFNNQFTTRNAPGLFNMAWHKEMHWDGGINNIEVQPLAPITAPNEMAEDITTVINKLKADPKYPGMFAAAFGSEEINSQRMLKAITQFVTLMISANAKYDKVKRGETAFTAEEQTGYTLFQSKCSSCHKEPLFTDLSYRNNGMPLNPSLKDAGRMSISNNKADSLKFKVPSLRNVLLTFPYGHDGRFYSVYQVMEHYNSGIQSSTTLDPLLKNKIPLTDADKYYLYQFFKTLSDSAFINDKRFAQPE